MTDLVDDLTEADLAAMWMSRPNRSVGSPASAPWFANPFAGVPPEQDDAPFDVPIKSQPGLEVDGKEEPLTELEGRITSMAARLAAETREWLRLVAEFNRRKGWVQWGMRSMAHWLSWSCSVGPGVAREYVRVATALTKLPQVDEAFAQGTLSYSKVRAVTRVADRVDEETLLEQAKVHSAAQLEKVVRGYRKADRVDRPVEERRRARWFYDDDGMLVLSARLTAEEGALFIAALEQARTGELEPAGCPDEAVDPAQLPSDVDALVALATMAQAAGPVDSSGDDRHLVVVHADALVLAGEQDPGPDAQCRIEHGPGLTAVAARRLACDAALVAWVSSAVHPGEKLKLGRKTRKISAALRRALRFRDGGCQFPGCPRKRFLDAHHVVHWADGGPTNLRNLILLCQRHHRAVHDDGFTLNPLPEPGRWVFHRPDGTPVPAAPTPEAVPAETSEQAPDRDPDRLRPAQHGEPFSLRDSVDVFCRNAAP
ncbi:DUF222 domain-containing protein [Nakamurella sp.]|uniref:HNH endonuclease signature motif containing protein n=1 Tax=Nakamurella sp. TaxID=1869182 RepID=UPI00378350DE